MTSKRQKKAGFRLPSVINPAGRLCVTFQIPEAEEYVHAIIGHLYQMSKWWAWEKSYVDGDTRARDAAELWRALLNSTLAIGECGEEEIMFRLRQNEENSCLLEQTLDGGQTWSLAFDYALCLNSATSPQTRISQEWVYEESPDGGQTWIPRRDKDPRFISTPREISPNINDKCDAASSVVAILKDKAEEIAQQRETGATLAQIAAAIVGLLALLIGSTAIGLLASPLLLEIAAGIISLTAAAWRALFTDEVWDAVACAVYCHVSDEYTFSESAWSAVAAELESIGGEHGQFLVAAVRLMGPVGLTNAARAGLSGGIEVCDCTCGWCYEWDVKNSGQQGWQPTTWQGSGVCSVYEAGYGFRSRRLEGGVNFGEFISIKKDMGLTAYVTRIEVHLSRGMRSVGGYPRLMAKANMEDVTSGIYANWQYYTPQGSSNATMWALNFETAQPFSAITLWLTADATGNVGYYPIADDCYITKIVFRGEGNNPFGEDNCE